MSRDLDDIVADAYRLSGYTQSVREQYDELIRRMEECEDILFKGGEDEVTDTASERSVD